MSVKSVTAKCNRCGSRDLELTGSSGNSVVTVVCRACDYTVTAPRAITKQRVLYETLEQENPESISDRKKARTKHKKERKQG